MPTKARPDPADHFTAIPLIIAAVIWLLTIVPPIYGAGGFFIDPMMLPGLMILPWAIIAWLALLGVAVWTLRWRRALSIFGAGLGFISISFLTLISPQDIRFQTMRPFYLMQVARLHPPEGEAKKLIWWWSGGLGWDVSLSYDETDADKPPPGHPVLTRNVQGCPERIRPMGHHFYLHNLDCGDRLPAIEAGYEFGRQLDKRESAEQRKP
jgi:hypothetical protein